MEKVYHYLWKSKMFGRHLRDNCGNEIEVIDPGIHNCDAGPDFFNSKIKVGKIEWVGNIEIHVKASDWYNHGHHNDPNYDNIILHVVGVSDRNITRKDGSLIPQVEITFPERFFNTLSLLSSQPETLRCASCLQEIPPLNLTDCFESVAAERLQSKAQHVMTLLKNSDGNWEKVCFILLARSLGFGVNNDPFELLAKSIPLNFLSRHSDNLFQLQSILFGQASMLDSSQHIFDEYFQNLCAEYYFLSRKYGLQPLKPGLWKYSRTRPQNFPHRRIAFLAKACEGGFSLFSKILECRKNTNNLRELFRLQIDNYWHNHFSFDTPAVNAPCSLSEASITLLLINMVSPILYAYASATGDIDLGEAPFDLLAGLPAENNQITRQWRLAGVSIDNASQSQAVIHLKKNYCDLNKCLYCRLGYYFLKQSSIS